MKNLILAIIITFVGVGVCIWGIGTLGKAKASSAWPTTGGKVITSKVEKHKKTSGSTRKRRRSTTYKAQVLYEYTVDGIRYSSKKVSFGEYSSSNPTHARQIINRYPEGKNVKVYFNPDKPNVSVLEPGVSLWSYMPLGIGAVFIIVGVFKFLGPFIRGR